MVSSVARVSVKFSENRLNSLWVILLANKETNADKKNLGRGNSTKMSCENSIFIISLNSAYVIGVGAILYAVD